MEQNREKEAAQRRNASIMQTLAALGGGQFRAEDDIVSEGTKLVLPAGMSMKRGIKVLMERIAADEETTSYSRSYKYRPWDGAVCAWRALREVFGLVSGKATTGFFGGSPPQMLTIRTGSASTDTEQVPWGAFTVAAFENTTFSTDSIMDEDLGQLFILSITGPRKYRAQFEGIFTLIEQKLITDSIYRGKAFDGQNMPEFLDLTGVSEDKVVYSAETMVQLEANIWNVLRYREELEKAGISRKRAALLHGPYGTGKTLAGFLTAQKAVASGWTFLYCRPAKDDIERVLQTARLYQPACVFFEDMDTVSDPAEDSKGDRVTRLLDVLDGITAKGTELVAVLTTNHPERIHKGMLRPGRLDSVIEVGALDNAGIRRLMETVLPEGSIDSAAIGWEDVTAAAEGYLPAYVKEAADRAWRYALSRDGDPKNIRLTTQDLVHAAQGLRPQLAMMEDASDEHQRDPMGQALKREVTAAVVQSTTDAFHEGWIRPEVVAEHNGG